MKIQNVPKMDRHDAERASSERLEQAAWLLRRSFRLLQPVRSTVIRKDLGNKIWSGLTVVYGKNYITAVCASRYPSLQVKWKESLCSLATMMAITKSRGRHVLATPLCDAGPLIILTEACSAEGGSCPDRIWLFRAKFVRVLN